MNGVAELRSLLRQKAWDKEVVLWLGSDAALKDELLAYTVQELDLLDLFDPNNLPANDDVARDQLISRAAQVSAGPSTFGPLENRSGRPFRRAAGTVQYRLEELLRLVLLRLRDGHHHPCPECREDGLAFGSRLR